MFKKKKMEKHIYSKTRTISGMNTLVARLVVLYSLTLRC